MAGEMARLVDAISHSANRNSRARTLIMRVAVTNGDVSAERLVQIDLGNGSTAAWVMVGFDPPSGTPVVVLAQKDMWLVIGAAPYTPPVTPTSSGR